MELTDPSATTTVVLYVSPRCRFCTASMPFYKRLHDAASRGTADAVLRFSNVDGDELVLTVYLRQHDIETSGISRGAVPPEVRGTPTVLVLDRDGRVVTGWVGVLSSDQEDTLLNYWK